MQQRYMNPKTGGETRPPTVKPNVSALLKKIGSAPSPPGPKAPPKPRPHTASATQFLSEGAPRSFDGQPAPDYEFETGKGFVQKGQTSSSPSPQPDKTSGVLSGAKSFADYVTLPSTGKMAADEPQRMSEEKARYRGGHARLQGHTREDPVIGNDGCSMGKDGSGINIKPSHKGLLHKNLGVPAGSPIPAGKLASAANSSDPAVKKRAVFAENARKWHH